MAHYAYSPKAAETFVDSRDSTRSEIIKIAAGLFSQFGYVGVAMSKIANQLGITKAALYYHFDSKRSLYIETLNQAFGEFMSALGDIVTSDALSHREKIKEIIIAYLELGLQNGSLAQLTIQKLQQNDRVIYNHIRESRKKMISLIEPVIRDYVHAEKKLLKVSHALMTQLFVGMLDSYILRCIVNKETQHSPRELAQQIGAAFFS